MRIFTLATVSCWILFSAAIAGAAEKKGEPLNTEHPGSVALHESAPGKWVYRTFPSLMPLYVYDGDSLGVSNCYKGCSGVWPPLKVDADAVEVGNWKILMRTDGRRQWVYKGRPVYLRYHDDPANPVGDGEEGKWHLIQP